MRKIILSFAACLALAAYGQKPVQDTRAMDTFIDQLMGKMTLDEKIGQLNSVSYTHLTLPTIA